MRTLNHVEIDRLRELVTSTHYIDDSDISSNDLSISVASQISIDDRLLHDWINDVEVVFAKGDIADKDRIKFEGKKLILTTERWRTIHSMNMTIRTWIEDRVNHITSGKNIESVLPYTFEQLFIGKAPHRAVEIKEFYNEENFSYVMTVIDTERKIGRGKNVRYRSDLVEREIIIEKWYKSGEVQYKTKGKEFKEKFTQHLDQKKAPKTNKISISQHTGYVRNGTPSPLAIIKFNDDGAPYIYTELQVKFDGSFKIAMTCTPHATYISDDLAVIDFYTDNFNSGKPVRTGYERQYYEINSYSGLIKTDNPPDWAKEIANEDKVPFLTSAPLSDDPIIPTSEDETQILDQLEYDFIVAEKTLVALDAIEYEVKNTLNLRTAKCYFAKYGDVWVQTIKQNPKVTALLEASEFADILTSGWK